MSRRRPSDAPITLFSFQDIVTCLTGILIVIVLLMVVELMSRKVSTTPVAGADGLSDLRARVASLKVQRAAMPDAGPAGTEAPGPPARILRRRVQQEREREAALQKEADRLRHAAEMAERSLQESPPPPYDRGQDEARLMELEQERERMERGDLIFFVPGEQAGRTPILVQFGREGVKAGAYAKNGTVLEFDDPDSISLDASIARFLQWLATQDRVESYLVLFLKPSGVAYFGSLYKRLKSDGWSFGYEPLGEAQEVLLAPGRPR